MRGSRSFSSVFALALVLVSACGGTATPPSAANSQCEGHPDNCGGPIPGHDDNTEQSPPEPDAAKPADDKPAETKPPEKKPSDAPAPSFKENGSVLEAINAVPQGTPRLNIEQEALGQPLGKVELYEPCKPGNAHFKAKVAVWDGKAVGLDLTTTPKNAKFGACIAERIRSITWPDKVKSLNVVEYTF